MNGFEIAAIIVAIASAMAVLWGIIDSVRYGR